MKKRLRQKEAQSASDRVRKVHPLHRRRFIKSQSERRIATILVPIDFSLQSRKALEYASMFMTQRGGSITLLHVVKPEVSLADYGYGPVIRQTADESVIHKARIRLNAMRKTSLGVAAHATTLIRTGAPDSEIVRAAKDLEIDLIVMGCGSLTTSPRAPTGGVAQSVVGLAPCPVLVVRSKNKIAFFEQSSVSEPSTLN